ncbi:MAG: glycoside hydrolase family 13 protein [Clostridiales bacterium]|nr:glycoside hydrolase family 13 protein [Clostridiales bacterium]
MYRFDESDPACKSPQGAIPQGQPLSLTLRYQRGLCKKAYLQWKADGGETSEMRMGWTGIAGIDDLFHAQITVPGTGLYWYWFKIETGDGFFIIDREGPRDESQSPYQLTVYDQDLTTPDWIKGGVMYHIFVDRFARGGEGDKARKAGSILREDWGGTPSFLPDKEGFVRNNDFFGGDLEGVIRKLPYLESQGVTCLYLSPIFEADSNHKYDTGDYHRIDPGFGDEATLTRLCKEAESKGIRIVLDGVFSHVGVDSVYFNQYGHYDSLGAYQSVDSPYYNWFTFKEWPVDYESWWGILLLPAINKQEPSYQAFISGEGGVVEHWLCCGVKGWRLDVVDELPDAFLDPLCKAVRRKDPDALIIGEVWEDASNKIAYGVRRRYLLGGQLDSVMNYPLKDAIIAFIREKNADVLADTMEALLHHYPKPVLDALMNLLGTHDTMRILTVLGGGAFPDDKEEMALYRLTDQQRAKGRQMLKIASALQFTLPGFPCIYYGDEAGMEGGADPFNRVCYPWGEEDRELIAWYQLLASIRRSQPVFREGVYRLAAAREGVFAFTRGEGLETVLIAANLGEENFTFPPGDFWYDQINKEETYACAVSGMSVGIFSRGR